ncbi:protein containg FOG: FHA domain [Longilinea arvoryzae]|uniref:Protein containg FOG: FHA domain n=1 Tax=Longilinea arvoryzae TaxID=360412 RepID=A0A0S7BK73_9CHLR|nr:FHA domain-containing protein [Longilinea arvoryzae]GAP14610.1 protein containg FOG: FHA domain [Longilinea arvoryzae]
MILCPNCHVQNLPGALFCSECGTQLVFTDVLKTHAFKRNPSDALDPNILQAEPGTEEAPQAMEIYDASLSLHLVECGQVLHLAGRNEFTFGRVTEGQPILPDVDLSPYEAYSQGVSRLHASIKIVGQRVTVMDLGSSNGTRVNGQKIIPHVDYPLSHGDIVSLGKLKFQILIDH